MQVSDYSCIIYFILQILVLNRFQLIFWPVHTFPTPARVPRTTLLLVKHQHQGKTSRAWPNHLTHLTHHCTIRSCWKSRGVCAELHQSQSSLAFKVQKEVHICFFCELGKYSNLGHTCEAWNHLSKEDLLTIYLRLAT